MTRDAPDRQLTASAFVHPSRRQRFRRWWRWHWRLIIGWTMLSPFIAILVASFVVKFGYLWVFGTLAAFAWFLIAIVLISG